MQKRSRLLAITTCILIPIAVPVVAAQRQAEESKLWIRNLASHPTEATLGNGTSSAHETISVPAEAAVEIFTSQPGLTTRRLLRADTPLFVLQVPRDFNAEVTEIEKAPSLRFVQSGERKQLVVSRPEWIQSLMQKSAVLSQGSAGHASLVVERTGSPIEVAVALLEPRSSVRIRLLDSQDQELRSLTASSSQPLRWRTVLGELPADGVVRVEMQVLRGQAQATAAVLTPGARTHNRVQVASQVAAKETGGVGYFSDPVSWASSYPLYYSIGGGPANTCGDLMAYRNGGPWVRTPGWICTDAAGNAEKGPWYWADQPNDETALAYIEWPNSQSSVEQHIWDKTCAETQIDALAGNPPSSFTGTATDAAWGAGFSSQWTGCYLSFFQEASGSQPGTYWSPRLQAYEGSPSEPIPCTINGMPGMSVSWSAGSVPPASAHQAGRCYDWDACLTDGYCGQCTTYHFCT